MNLRTTALVLGLAAFLGTAAAADDLATVKTKTRSVAAFKNGLGFFIREGNAQIRDGWAVSDVLPQSALGTFWVGSPKKGVRIERLVASEDTISRSVPAASVPEMLAANIGKRIRLLVYGKEFEGQLLAVSDSKGREKQITTPFLPNPNQPDTTSIILLKTVTGTMAIPLNSSNITWVEILDSAVTESSYKEKVKRLKFKISGNETNIPITMAYLQKGLMWSPAYLVELTDDKTARITMQGLLSNDVEDIEDAEVSFVVGYPNFMYSDILSPLALTQSVTSFVSTITGLEPGGRRAPELYQSAMANTAIGYNYAADARPQSDFDYSTTGAATGTQEEDLFLYKVKNVSLKSGERAYCTIFSAEVPYEHVYDLQIPDQTFVDRYGNLDSSRILPRNNEPQIWHQLKIKNTSAYPWTTAPAMAVSDNNPLSQDRLDYTPVGATGKLKLTVAADIKSKQSEIEISRVNDAITINTSRYTKVNVNGTITLKSFKSKPVKVFVKKTLTGEAVTEDKGGKAQKLAAAIQAVNPVSEVSWELTLNPGEEKTLNYSYFVYIH